jgi:RNA polymerase sigma factor (sigma-70 family)
MEISRKQAQKLVKGCINNSRTDQEVLYKFYHADMLRVCGSYLPDKELAKEAFNTGFLKVFQSIKNFDAEIMIFTSIDICRSELKFNNEMSLEDDGNAMFIPPNVLEKLFFEDILKHIRTLPFATQTVFNLSVLDGFSHKEISEQLRISEGTSRWHLSEAKRQLRTLLGTFDLSTGRLIERSGRIR